VAFERRFQSCRADDRRHDPIRRPARGFEQRRLACANLDVSPRKRRAQGAVCFEVGDNCKLGAVQDGELGETSGVVAAGEGDDVVGRGVPADQV